MNTDFATERTCWVTIDAGLHSTGGVLTCRYSTNAPQIGTTTSVEARHGKALLLTVPAAGFVIYE